jgi:hypothetical protein
LKDQSKLQHLVHHVRAPTAGKDASAYEEDIEEDLLSLYGVAVESRQQTVEIEAIHDVGMRLQVEDQINLLDRAVFKGAQKNQEEFDQHCV